MRSSMVCFRRRERGQSMVEYMVVLAFGVMVLTSGPGADVIEALTDVVNENYRGYSYAMSLSPLPDYDSASAHSLALGTEGVDAQTIASLATDPVQHMSELSEYNDKFSKLNTVNTAINSLGSMQSIINDMVQNAVSFF